MFASCSGASVQHLVDKGFHGTREESPDLESQIAQINRRLTRSGDSRATSTRRCSQWA